MVTVKLNLKNVERVAQEAFRDACFLQGRVFTEVISEPGAFEGFPQDIVDTGQLRSSQTLEFPDDKTGVFRWDVSYGIFVHDGFTRRNGTVVDGRPWTKLGLERFDFDGTLAKLMALKLK